MSRKLARPIGQPIAACVALTAPALVLRLAGVHPPAALGLLTFGAAVVAASFLLAWAAEAARLDIAGPLAIAILAVIAVLPEYAVDLYFEFLLTGAQTLLGVAALLTLRFPRWLALTLARSGSRPPRPAPRRRPPRPAAPCC